MLDWRTIPQANRDAHMVKGAEIERCIPEGFRSRFSITSVRCYDAERNADARYRVRDVEAANDAHFAAGKPAPIFGEYATLEEALAAIEPHRVPECVYCGAHDGLRKYHDCGGFAPQDYVCEACFVGADDGPCFDDLPAA